MDRGEDEFANLRSKQAFFDWFGEYAASKCTLAGLAKSVRPSRREKAMEEEVRPVYNYVRRCYSGVDLSVQFPNDSGSADAVLRDSTGKVIEYIQVTVPVQREEHVIRKKILTTGLSVADYLNEETYSEYAATVNKVIAAKINGFAYEPNTTLLVPLSSNFVLEDEEQFRRLVALLNLVPHGHQFNRVVAPAAAAHCLR